MRLGLRRKTKLVLRVKGDHVYYFKDAREKLVLAVWDKGKSVSGKDKAVWRKDIVGNLMKYSEHGDRKAPHGWEMDHIIPRKHGGSDKLINLQPLYWKANKEKGDKLNWPEIRLGIKTKRTR